MVQNHDDSNPKKVVHNRLRMLDSLLKEEGTNSSWSLSKFIEVESVTNDLIWLKVQPLVEVLHSF